MIHEGDRFIVCCGFGLVIDDVSLLIFLLSFLLPLY